MSGFTLLELMMVLAVMGVLVTLAAPSFQQMMASNRVKGAASNLHAAMLKSRSEAVKRNTTVTLTPKGDWSSGWQIATGGVTLSDEGAIKGGVTITGGGAISYLQSGRISGAAPAFTVTDTNSHATRCVSADASGRPYVRNPAPATSC